MVDRAVDPLAFAIDRAEARFDFGSAEGSRQAAEWVLAILARVPGRTGGGLDLKVAKALDTLSRQALGPRRRPETPARRSSGSRTGPAADGCRYHAEAGRARRRRPPIRPADLDPIDRELVQIVLNEPGVVGRLITRVTVASLRDAPLRAILQACYDLHGEGSTPTFDRVTSRLDDPALRALAAGLLLPIEAAPLTEGTRAGPDRGPARRGPRPVRRARPPGQAEGRQAALAETDPEADPVGYRALRPRILSTLIPAAGHEEVTRPDPSSREGGIRMEKMDEGLKTLLDLGKRRGFLTFDQVNDFLPDEASSPEKIPGLLESLDELGIELINEDEAESRLAASGDLDDEPDDLVDEPVDDDEDGELTPEDLDEISRRIDDPVRMYLTQMGEIPLLTRDQEIGLAKKIEITRKRFRRKVLECDYALRLVVDVLKKVNDGELPFDRTVKVSVTENLEKDQILGRMPHNLATLAHLMDLQRPRLPVLRPGPGRQAGPPRPPPGRSRSAATRPSRWSRSSRSGPRRSSP